MPGKSKLSLQDLGLLYYPVMDRQGDRLCPN
jgi:hypothetical protein